MSDKKVTYGSNKVEGIIVGMTYEDVPAKDGKNPYRKLQLGVKTSKTNVVYYEAFGAMTPEVGVKDQEGNRYKEKFVNRYNLPTGHKLSFTITCGLEQDANGKNIIQALTPYDAVEYMNQNLKQGDSVFILGRTDFSTYQKNGETVLQRKYNPSRIYKKAQPIDFEAEGFSEVSSFEQEIIFKDMFEDTEAQKMLLTANIVKGLNPLKFEPALFTIDLKEYREFGEALKDDLRFGDFLKVEGRLLSGTELSDKPKEEPKMNRWGGQKPAGYDNQFIENKVNELRITFADGESYVEAMYEESDFIVFNGNQQSQDNGLPIDISSDDLPF